VVAASSLDRRLIFCALHDRGRYSRSIEEISSAEAGMADRQKRKVKKRARREKRLAKRVAYLRRRAPPLYPMGLPKMSAVLPEFAAPLLDGLSESAGAAEWRAVLLLASTIWNMTRLADERLAAAGEQDAHALQQEAVDQLTVATGRPRHDCESLVAALVERKRALFGDDPRIVINVDTIDTDSGVHVFAASSF
jgi:hypothetical protein